MNSKVRAAVVGVGYLGRFHAQKYKSIDNAVLVAVCDSNTDNAKKSALELSCESFANYKDLLGKVDAVTIAATTSAHYEIAKFFLKNNIHVNVEKPITSTTVQAQELCELAYKNNLKLQVGHIERFNPALVAAKKKLRDPIFIECHRLAPFKPRGVDVSVVLDLMIHDLDVILSLVNSEPKHVHSVGTPVLTPEVDIANARVEFENGCVANITSSRVSKTAQRKFRVFQQDQYLSIDFGSGDVSLTTKIGDFSESGELPLEVENWSLEKGDALLAETQSFVDSIIKDIPCIVTGEDGLKALKLAETIVESFK